MKNNKFIPIVLGALLLLTASCKDEKSLSDQLAMSVYMTEMPNGQSPQSFTKITETASDSTLYFIVCIENRSNNSLTLPSMAKLFGNGAVYDSSGALACQLISLTLTSTFYYNSPVSLSAGESITKDYYWDPCIRERFGDSLLKPGKYTAKIGVDLGEGEGIHILRTGFVVK